MIIRTDPFIIYYLVDDRNPSGYAQVLEELTISGASTNLNVAYTYGLDLISRRQPSVSTNFYGYDGNGNVRFLANPSGQNAGVYVFDAYGNILLSTVSPANKYRYAGEQFDTELNFYYLRARYYQPNSGRFWTMDSFEGSQSDPMSLHRYAYCHNNPVNGIDPTGNFTDWIMAAADFIGTLNTPEPSSAALPLGPGTAGPDITKTLKRTLLDVEATFYSWTRKQKSAAAGELHNTSGGRGDSAWDIIPLKDVGFQGSFLIVGDESYKAGSGVFGRTVTFNNKCYYAGAVNYALWGKLHRLIHDYYELELPPSMDYHLRNSFIQEYDIWHATGYMRAWKHYRYHDFGTEAMQAEAFTVYGYNGNLSSPALAAKPSRTVVKAAMFEWCSEPSKPRLESYGGLPDIVTEPLY